MSSTAMKTVCQSCGGVIWRDWQHICFATLPVVVYTCAKCGSDVENIGMHTCVATGTSVYSNPYHRDITMQDKTTRGTPPDLVNHPPHYKRGGLECIDVIDALGLTRGFCVGNAIKYLFRLGEKESSTEIEDAKKSAWYINHYIEYLEKGAK